MDGNSEVKMLSELADKYRDTASRNTRENWAELLKAHTLYNSCAVRSSNKKWQRLVFEVQKMYWKEDVSSTLDQQMTMSQEFKRELYMIRDNCRDELSSVANLMNKWDCKVDNLDSIHNHNITTEFCDVIKRISLKTSTQMKVLAGKIIQKSVELCGGRQPCKFTAVAMGSLAKGEATPYSDLEFMFLVERKDEEIIKFFELLAMTVYFLIGNIQETKLKYMNIEELKNFDDKCKNGFKIDGLQSKAGNIPTGNGTPEQRNRFILTVSELVDQYQSVYLNPDPKDAVKGDLTSMLAHTATLYGDHAMLKEFQMAQRNTKSNAARDAVHEEMIRSDIRDYSFLPLGELQLQNHSVDLKSAIYRFPSLFIYNLKIICNISSATSWQTLEKLLSMRKLSQSFHYRLRLLLASAVYIRLAAYLHHNSQNERMSFLKQLNIRGTTIRSADAIKFWHVPQSLAYHMSLHMIPVKQSIEMKDFHEILEILSQDIEFDKDIVAAYYLFNTLNYVKALAILETRPCDSYLALEMLAHCYMVLKKWELFRPVVLRILEITSYTYKPSNRTLHLSWMLRSALGYELGGDLKAAKQTFDELMFQLDNFPDRTCTDFMGCEPYMLAARFSIKINDWDMAEKYYNKGNVILEELSESSQFSEASGQFNRLHNKGVILLHMRRYAEAQVVLKEHIRLCQQAHGVNACHVPLAFSYQALAVTYDSLKQLEKAFEFHEMARKILEELDPTTHEYGDLCGQYVHNAFSHEKLGDFSSSLHFYQEALVLAEKGFGTQCHKVADLNRRIASVLRNQGHLPDAEKYLKKAFSIYSSIDTQYLQEFVATCHLDMGHLLADKGQPTEALKYYWKVFSFKVSMDNLSHQDLLCKTYLCIGNILRNKWDLHSAIKCFKKALSHLPKISELPTECIIGIYICLSGCFVLCFDHSMAYHWLLEALKFLIQQDSDYQQKKPECFMVVFAFMILQFKTFGEQTGVLMRSDNQECSADGITLFIGHNGEWLYL